LKVVINGAGAAGTAIAKLLRCVGHDPNVCVPVADVIVCDSKGAIHEGRDDLNEYKKELLKFTNRDNRSGTLQEVLVGCDAFIGVSKGNLLTKSDVQTMADKAIVLAMANPIPEIMPDEAKAGGAAVVGTGRSDFPNQVNNLLAFPGIFRGALDANADRITESMKISAFPMHLIVPSLHVWPPRFAEHGNKRRPKNCSTAHWRCFFRCQAKKANEDTAEPQFCGVIHL